ncbi:MAG: hypothetical protein Q7S47_00495 [bacterium]|nr:hypothetical protein [bacterium]
MKLPRGITLIEIVMYVGLLSIILTSSVLILFQIIAGSSRLEHRVRIQNESQFMIDKISSLLPYGVTVTTPPAGAHGETLTAIAPDSLHEHTIFYRDGSFLMIRRGQSAALQLNATETPISHLNFSHHASTTTSTRALTVTLEIDGEEFSQTHLLLP